MIRILFATVAMLCIGAGEVLADCHLNDCAKPKCPTKNECAKPQDECQKPKCLPQNSCVKTDCAKPKCETKAPCDMPKADCNPCKNQDDGKICKELDKENICYFDNQYARLKKSLCLDSSQVRRIDCYYGDFKDKMLDLKYEMNIEQKQLCAMIEKCASNDAIKDKKRAIKEIKKCMKEEYKAFKDNVNSELTTEQKREFRKFNRAEGRKMRKLAKNCSVFRFPCLGEDCFWAPCKKCD